MRRSMHRSFYAASDGRTIFTKTLSMIKSRHRQWEHNQLIRKVEAEAKATVTKTINQLHRLHAPPVICDDTVIDHDVDGTVPALNFVSPSAAQVQKKYVPLSSVNQQSRLCFYVGYCNDMAETCGGYGKGLCHNVNSGAVAIPADQNKFKRVKERAKRKKRAEKAREDQKRQKQQA